MKVKISILRRNYDDLLFENQIRRSRGCVSILQHVRSRLPGDRGNCNAAHANVMIGGEVSFML